MTLRHLALLASSTSSQEIVSVTKKKQRRRTGEDENVGRISGKQSKRRPDIGFATRKETEKRTKRKAFNASRKAQSQPEV